MCNQGLFNTSTDEGSRLILRVSSITQTSSASFHFSVSWKHLAFSAFPGRLTSAGGAPDDGGNENHDQASATGDVPAPSCQGDRKDVR